MSKRSKLYALMAAFVGGATIFQGCSGFWSGWLRRGFVGRRGFQPLDVLTDWLNEDLFG